MTRRHPRGGGDPCKTPRKCGPEAGVPAIVPEARLRRDAGMTLERAARSCVVIPAVPAPAKTGVPGIQPSADGGASGTPDPGDKRRDDTVVFCLDHGTQPLSASTNIFGSGGLSVT